MMKTTLNRALSVSLSAMLVGSMMLPAAWAAQFTDVSGHWAQSSILDLSQKGIITGYPTGEFRPEGQITRAEFATMLVKALNAGNDTATGYRFNDVPDSFWGARAIGIVSSKGWVAGYPGGYFRPGQNITRAESMAILTKAARIPLPNTAETSQILSRFTDADQIPQWAAPSVAAAVQSGIFANFPNANLIEPNQPATRGEVAAMADRMENYLAQGPAPATTATGTQTTTQGGTSSSITQDNNLYRGRIAVVPAQTTFTGVLVQAISSDRNQVGDPVTITLDRPLLSAAGEIVIPQNSQLQGTIVSVIPAGRAEANGKIGMDFNRVITPDGKTYPLSAEINAENGILVGGSKLGRTGRIAGRTVGGAAIGGAAGAVIGRIAGGKERTNEGALWGSLLGGGLGAASAVQSKGNEVNLQPGEILEIRLRQPLTLNPAS